ncbi:MAG: hypothetical protein II714_01485, partial [Oscillospiraceae bacterium]|nr:hypothetical protein [Oscillospiraceae bacterium]
REWDEICIENNCDRLEVTDYMVDVHRGKLRRFSTKKINIYAHSCEACLFCNYNNGKYICTKCSSIYLTGEDIPKEFIGQENDCQMYQSWFNSDE